MSLIGVNRVTSRTKVVHNCPRQGLNGWPVFCYTACNKNDRVVTGHVDATL